MIRFRDGIKTRQDADPVVKNRVQRATVLESDVYDVSLPLGLRLRASELLGQSHADFAAGEVARTAPIVTDPHFAVVPPATNGEPASA